MEERNKQEILKKIIQKKAIITSDQHKIISMRGQESKWIFDFRKVFLSPKSLALVTDIFWNMLEKEYPFQLGGQELAAVPLISALILKSQQSGKPVNGFIIRKSRKKTGLQKIIEGEINEEKIILIDDLINSGDTIIRQLEQLRKLDKKVHSVFTLVNFRENQNKERLKKYQIKLKSLFNLSDFGLEIKENFEIPNYFELIWKFSSPNPSYTYVIPKSTPAIDEKKIYFGSDSGFWALNQEDGSIFWKFEVGYPVLEKNIFSSPALFKNLVYFGAYDGNTYAINKNTGKIKWKFTEADFVGSSPVLAPELNLLFIGLEFGLLKKHGKIAALNLKTGKKIWDYEMENFVHCSPAYCSEKKLVAIGDNDGFVYMFDAKNGNLKWKFKAGGDVKASLVFDINKNLLLFGSFDKFLYALDIISGKVKGKFKTKEAIYSTPLIYDNKAFIASLDKHLYCIDLKTGSISWDFPTNGRIFSSPEIVGKNLFFGSNDGKMYELDPETGKIISISQFTERITNKIIFNKKTKRFFVTSFINEIYCLKHALY